MRQSLHNFKQQEGIVSPEHIMDRDLQTLLDTGQVAPGFLARFRAACEKIQRQQANKEWSDT